MALTERERNLLADVRQYERSFAYDITPQEEVAQGIVEDELGFSFQAVCEVAVREGALVSDVLEVWLEEDHEARE